MPDPRVLALPAFEYRPLPNKHSIRILHILPGAESLPICCDIETVTLDDNPQYDALSYVWGQPIYNEAIIIANSDEQDAVYHLGITTSLHEALTHLRNTGRGIPLWVDAICINQEDLGERGSQVEIMSRIYGEAEFVPIWLGLADEVSEVAFDWISSCYDGFRQNKLPGISPLASAVQRLEQGRQPELPAEVSCESCLRSFAATFSGMEHELSGVSLEDSSALSTRQWWRRTWVIQELIFARNAVFMCGSRFITWQMLEILSEIFNDDERTKLPAQFTEGLDRVQRAFRHIELYRITRAGIRLRGRRRLDLGDILQTFVATCRPLVTDPRDNFWALRSLCHSYVSRMIPDYRKGLVEIYTGATEILLEEKKNLHWLCHVMLVNSTDKLILEILSRESHVPSWIVDIGSCLPQPSYRHRQNCFSAGGDGPCDWRFGKCCSQARLFVRGIHCEIVQLVGFSTAWDGNAAGQSSANDNFDGCVHPALVMAATWQREPDSLWRTMMWDCSLPRPFECDGPLRLSDEHLARVKEEFYSKVIIEEKELTCGALQDKIQFSEEYSRRVLLELADFGHMKYWSEAVRFCCFKSGNIGWVPEATRPGDEVYVVFGCPMPLVMRPACLPHSGPSCSGGCHVTIVGPAYVQDSMDGQVIARTSKDDIESICIH